MGLLAELQASPPRQMKCSVCVWLQTRPPDEQAEWATALADESITTTALFRAAKARGYGFGNWPMKRHRAGHS